MKSERDREISWEKDIWQWHLLQRKKGKKGTQIQGVSVEGEHISKNITLQMEPSPVCLNINFPGAVYREHSDGQAPYVLSGV